MYNYHVERHEQMACVMMLKSNMALTNGMCDQVENRRWHEQVTCMMMWQLNMTMCG